MTEEEVEFVNAFDKFVGEKIEYMDQAMKEVATSIREDAIKWHDSNCPNKSDVDNCRKGFLIAFNQALMIKNAMDSNDIVIVPMGEQGSPEEKGMKHGFYL